MPHEGVGRRRPEAADQADAERAGVVAFDMRADLGLAPTGGNGPIAVDDPVIADVAPAPVAGVPKADFRDLGGNGLPFQPGGLRRGAMHDDPAHDVASLTLADHPASVRHDVLDLLNGRAARLQETEQRRLRPCAETPVDRAELEIEKRQPALDIAQAGVVIRHGLSFRGWQKCETRLGGGLLGRSESGAGQSRRRNLSISSSLLRMRSCVAASAA